MTDDLRASIDALRAKSNAETKKRSGDKLYSRSARMQADARSSIRFLTQVTLGLAWVRRWIVVPVSRLLWRAGRRVWSWHRLLWSLIVYRRAPDDGRLLFTKWRAGMALLGAGFFYSYIFVSLLGLAYDSALYAMTAQVDERIYLFNSQELDPLTNAHNIEGADHYPWSPDDSIYFRAESTWFNQLWSVLHWHGLYWPEYIGAGVPTAVSRCVVTSYGYRVKFLWFNKFSYLLTYRCGTSHE